MPTARRPPTKSKIEASLRAAGYTRWGQIEFDESDRKWEVDDAYAADGKRYELDLDESFKILKKEPD